MFRNIAGELMRATLTQMRTGAVLLLCLAALPGWAATPNQSRPDVILVTIDTLRADHVGSYGYKRINTPRLDALARDGVRFDQAFTASPITNSSHASILTGLYPSTHGVFDFGVPLASDHLTIAELMKARGYRTAAFIGAVVLDSKQLAPGFDRGFDYYDNFPASLSGPRFGRLERRAMTVVEHAQKWMAANSSGPRFVWVHLYDPHDPYEPPAPYSQQYKDRLYDGEIAYADHALGDLLAFLRTQHRYGDSLVVVVGDHGEGLGEHGEDTHGIFLYDSTTHVPLIVKLPGGDNAGEVVRSQVRTVDIAPTILAYAGNVGMESAAPKFDGASLRSYIDSHAAEDRLAVGETDYPLRFGWAPLRSVRTRAYKFIEAPRPELYDLSVDPAEIHDTYEPWNENVQKSRELLVGLKRHSVTQSAGAVPRTTVDELRALGYLGPEGATNVPEPSLLADPKDKIAIQNLLHTAMVAGEDGRNAVAREALSKAVALDPQSAIALSQLGRAELKAHNYSVAADHLRSAAKLNQNDSTLVLDLGRALIGSGDLPGARKSLESALKSSPAQSEARKLLGDVLLRLQQPKQAAEQYEAAVFLRPEDASTHIGFARALLEAGEYERAIAQANEAIRIDARNRDTYLIIQRAYEKLGNPVLARKAAEQAASVADSTRP